MYVCSQHLSYLDIHFNNNSPSTVRVLITMYLSICCQVLTRRQLEEQSFRSSLNKAKAAFDNKIVKLSIKAKDRCVPLP